MAKLFVMNAQQVHTGMVHQKVYFVIHQSVVLTSLGNGHDLVLEVFYKFHKDKLETEKCRTIVEDTITNVIGISPVKLKLRLGGKQKKEEVSAEHVEDDILKAAEEIFKVDAV